MTPDARPRRTRQVLASLPVCLVVLLPACLPDLPPLSTCDIVSIRTESLPDGVVGQPYLFRLENNCPAGTNIFARWRVSGDPAPGVVFSEFGEISGRPTLAGTFPMEVSLHEFGGPLVDSRTFALVVRSEP